MKYNANYRGIVKAHGTNGKCRIFVPGVYASADENSESLPFAEPAQPLFAGCANGQGEFQYPVIGSTVWVFFENGDHHKPVFFASILGGSDAASNFQADKYIIKTKASTITIDDLSGDISIITSATHTTTVPTINIIASAGVNITSPLVKVTGGDVFADTISLKTHVHTQNDGNDAGGGVATTPPIG